MASRTHATPDETQAGWKEIEAFIAGVSELASAPYTLEEFADATLSRAVELLQAIEGCIWLADHTGDVKSLLQTTSPEQAPELLSNANRSHLEFLRSLVTEGRTRSSRICDAEGIEKDFLWIASPCRLDDQTIGIIEVAQPSSLSAKAQLGNERLLEMVSQLTESFAQRGRERELQRSKDTLRQRESFLRRVHSSLDLSLTAYQVVNEGMLLTGCDRVSLAVSHRGHLVVRAVSGIDAIDSKSEIIAAMRRLAEAVGVARTWVRFSGDSDSLPPQIGEPLLALVDRSHASSVDAVPLLVLDESGHEKLVGVLILERYREDDDGGYEERISAVANMSAAAIRNSLEHESLPLLWLSKSVSRGLAVIRSNRRRTVFSVAWALLLGILAIVTPAQFNVSSRGTAVPVSRRHLFAPNDAEVLELRCSHDSVVNEGQVLVLLRSRQLEFERERLRGEYQTLEKKLLAITSVRAKGRDARNQETFHGQLAAEEQELKQQLDSRLAQLRLIQEQQEQLTIKSPISGKLLTWDPTSLLTDRPVQRGQHLLTVADVSGDWQIELSIPSRSIGHVIRAQASSDEPLEVEFVVPSATGGSFVGRLQDVAPRIEVQDGERLAAQARVSVPSDANSFLRPGTEIRARIKCGARSVGFVWFHEIYDTFKRWILL